MARSPRRIESEQAVRVAIGGFEASKADFSDALIAELARLAGAEYTATFDRRAASHPGFRLLS
jgi:predicted nucleic-acid-binding protein